MFIRCQVHCTYYDFYAPIELYGDALQLRYYGHRDRPATLLLLAQVLLFRLGQEYDESIATKIRHLLAEIHPDNSRERRTADAIIRTCRLYRIIHSGNSTEVDDLVGDLDRSAYVPLYGYFDKPRLLDKLGVAFWARFQRYGNLDDLDKSIVLYEEALCLTPSGRHDRESIVACLGRSILRRLEVLGDLADVDTSANLVELGKKVVAALNNVSYGLSSEGLCDQIALISAADAALQYITRKVRSPPYILEVQSLVDEWNNKDGIPAQCKRELGLLLSFLGGEGEIKMRKLLAKADWSWSFKEYKIKETMEVLQNYMPYLQDDFATKLGIALAKTVLTRGSADDATAVACKVYSSLCLGAAYRHTFFVQLKRCQFRILRLMCDILERNGRVREAIVCFQQMERLLVGGTSFHGEWKDWERGERLRSH